MAALNFPPTPSAGTQYTDDNSALWEFDGVKWNVITNPTKRFFNGAKALTSVPISLTTVATATIFNTEVFDTGNYFDLLDGAKLSISATGYYRISGTFYTSSNGSGNSYTATLKKNGTVTLTSQVFAPNQSAFYDSTLVLNAGDYLEIYSKEDTATGSLLADSYVEIQKVGTVPSAGISMFDAFSGARVITSSPISLASTATGVAWTTADYDVNADVLGDTYWTVSSSTRLTVKQTGYFRIKAFLATGTAGTGDSYNIALTKNGSVNLANTSVAATSILLVNETYQLSKDDYIELIASEAGSVGTLTTDSYLEIIRLGV